jgi:hypothetical protein
MQNKAKVKIGKMNISIATIKDYDNEQRTINNKRYSKQTQFKPNLHFTAENTEYAEKKDISVSDCLIGKYALYAISPCSLRTRRLMKNKAKTNPLKANLKRARMKLNFYSTTLYENRLADNPQKANNNPIGKERIIKGDKK